MSPDVWKILSIDGGGIKGVFPASFLAHLEDSIEGKVGEYFDLIAGTSTGGIIALGLGLGFSAREILAFYEEYGPHIFSGSGFFRWVKQCFVSKYKSDPLKEALRETFQDRKLGESSTRLLIPSVCLETGEVYIYKTSHVPRLEKDYKELVYDIAMGTAAAPTYFPTHHTAHGVPLVDGGVWACNPTGFAVVEALAVLEWPKDSIKVLSLGSTETPLDTSAARRRSKGRLYWARRVADIFVAGQSSSSLGVSKLLIGGENSLYRINSYVSPKSFTMDGAHDINALKGLGQIEARKALPNLKEVFFSERAKPFEPCHKFM